MTVLSRRGARVHARWAAALAVGSALLTGGGSVVASPAGATATSACADDTGVTVVVDFGRLGGGVQIGCAAWPVSSGLDALERAGFDWTPVASQPSFVCRIEDKPADDACQVTPPSDKYWGYWHADRGGAWTYSARGAGSSQPASGSVDGWAFGDSVRPSVPPPPPYDPPTTPPPTTPPSTTQPPSTAPPVTSQPPHEQPSTGSAAPTSTASASSSPSASADSSSAIQTATATDRVATPAGDSAPPGAAEGGSSPAGTLAGVAAVLALAGAGGFVAWRRRLRPGE